MNKLSAPATPPLPSTLEGEVVTIKDDIERAVQDQEDISSRKTLISETQKKGTSHFEAFQTAQYHILRKKIRDMQNDVQVMLKTLPTEVVRASDPTKPSPSRIRTDSLREYKLLQKFVNISPSFESLDTVLFDDSVSITDIQKDVSKMKDTVRDIGTVFKGESMEYYHPAVLPISPGSKTPEPLFKK